MGPPPLSALFLLLAFQGLFTGPWENQSSVDTLVMACSLLLIELVTSLGFLGDRPPHLDSDSQAGLASEGAFLPPTNLDTDSEEEIKDQEALAYVT